MTIIVFILILGVIILDFTKLKKDDKKKSYIYITIVLMAATIFVVDKIELFKVSPLESFIKKMEPITTWMEKVLK